MDIEKKVTPNLNITLSWKETSDYEDLCYGKQSKNWAMNTQHFATKFIY